jgi:EmrB/QacA subfamily drug resistance transporter
MSAPLAENGTAAGAGTGPEPRRWLALVFIALAQLMVALDATIVSIALPSAQGALHISDADRQWMITAYTLAFGGLLLTGGRIADYMGRRRTFVTGLIGFAAASAVGGAAVNTGMLIGARALQGVFGALLAPTVLALIATTFTQPKERAKAFAVFGAIAGGGGAAGLILGGLLTEYLNWRWCLYVNVPIAIITATGGWYLISAERDGARDAQRDGGPSGAPAGRRARFDVPGVILAGGGLVSVVYACAEAVVRGWRAPPVLGLLAAGAVLLAAFVVVETRVAAPLLPLRIVLDRNRGGAYLAVAFTVAGLFGLFLFLTFYLQVVQRYSPVRAGLAFLPLSAAVLVSSGAIASRLLPYVAPRVLMVPGLTVAAGAMLLLTRLDADSGYVSYVLPAEILLGLGVGCVFVPAINTATQRVDRRDAGVAAAVVNTSQQVGGSVGTALLNTVAATATTSYLAAHPGAATAGLTHGYAVAAGWAAGILLAAALVSLVLVNAERPERPGPPESS